MSTLEINQSERQKHRMALPPKGRATSSYRGMSHVFGDNLELVRSRFLSGTRDKLPALPAVCRVSLKLTYRNDGATAVATTGRGRCQELRRRGTAVEIANVHATCQAHALWRVDARTFFLSSNILVEIHVKKRFRLLYNTIHYNSHTGFRLARWLIKKVWLNPPSTPPVTICNSIEHSPATITQDATSTLILT